MRRPPERNVALRKTCEHCGEGFTPTSNRSRYCTQNCKLSANHKVSPTGCHLWTGPMMKNGYGTTNIDSVPILVHRLAYETLVGPIFGDLFVCHRCDVRNCINPEHLFLGTSVDNLQDMARKGRNEKSRKLTNKEVLQIRSIVGWSYAELGRLYGVTEVMIRHIQLGNWWKHLLPENKIDNSLVDKASKSNHFGCTN